MVDRSLTDHLESMIPAASDAGRDRLLQLHFPSQLLTSPSSHRSTEIAKASPIAGASDNFHEDACRSFENYLVEMIVEEGKVRDLMDVEELLHCWKNLKCPVFVDLVSRFYGDLCEDLFSATASDDGEAAATP
ncbi:hypothetical protein CDL15_Pgr025250 [Punica granatum]|nr:hypothetical protein CDL15_Pgr025250 [Punica granatum]PKI73322.1 hypothetical protein CRG98_006260 [Punica granatum]